MIRVDRRAVVQHLGKWPARLAWVVWTVLAVAWRLGQENGRQAASQGTPAPGTPAPGTPAAGTPAAAPWGPPTGAALADAAALPLLLERAHHQLDQLHATLAAAERELERLRREPAAAMLDTPAPAPSASLLLTPLPSDAEYVDEVTLARCTGWSRRQLQSWRLRGGGPPFEKVGRHVRYPVAGVTRWFDERSSGAMRRLPRRGSGAGGRLPLE